MQAHHESPIENQPLERLTKSFGEGFLFAMIGGRYLQGCGNGRGVRYRFDRQFPLASARTKMVNDRRGDDAQKIRCAEAIDVRPRHVRSPQAYADILQHIVDLAGAKSSGPSHPTRERLESRE